MSRLKLSIHVSPSAGESADFTVAIGDKAMKQLKIPADSSLTLRFGSWRHPVQVVGRGPADGLRLPPALAARLGLHAGVKLSIAYKPGTRTLVAGPLVGVLLSRVYAGAQPDQLFGSVSSFCRELTTAAAQSGAFVFFFTPGDAKAGQTMDGWSYQGQRWRKSTFPIPDVVYNRLTTRKLENKPSVQHFFKEVKAQHQTAVFNDRFLNKTDVFQALKQEPSCQKYLPESCLYRNIGTLQTMIAKHPVVFLKPVTGSLGKGIMRVSRVGAEFRCDLALPGGTRRQRFTTLTGLHRSIAGRLKAQRHQVQTGLPLISVGGRPVDFRVLVQRGPKGEWAITSAVARIAGGGHFVSNIARGGVIGRVDSTLANSNLAASAEDMQAQLRRAALDIAKGIEARVTGHYAELGVDLAVDTHGRVWLLEVNSKPSKNDSSPAGPTKIRPSVRKMLLYSRYLAGF